MVRSSTNFRVLLWVLTPLGPVFANLFMHCLEHKLWRRRQRLGLPLPALYPRFIDDIFFVWYGTQDTLLSFLHDLNCLHTNIHIEFTSLLESVKFLHLVISKGPVFKRSRKLDLQTHQKRLNKYLYIPYNSFHPHYSKLRFIKAELMTYIR